MELSGLFTEEGKVVFVPSSYVTSEFERFERDIGDGADSFGKLRIKLSAESTRGHKLAPPRKPTREWGQDRHHLEGGENFSVTTPSRGKLKGKRVFGFYDSDPCVRETVDKELEVSGESSQEYEFRAEFVNNDIKVKL